jgi:hypothetical protein
MTWAFLDDRAHEHPKQVEIGGAAAWYWSCGLMYCRRLEEDRTRRGERVDFIPRAAALVLYADPKAKQHVAAIVRVGLWDEVEGGYVVHNYEKVYGRKALPPDPHPAGPAGHQPTPSQLGGKARAAGASRAPGGRFVKCQPAGPAGHQPAGPAAPAPRASGSGSDPGSGSDLSRKAAAEELEANRAREPAAAAAAPAADSKIPCPPDLRLTDAQIGTLRTALIPEYAITAVTTAFVAKATADESDKRTLVGWRKALAAAVSGDWNNPSRRPLPPDAEPSRGPRRALGGTSQDWPTDDGLRLREAIRSGQHGEKLKQRLELGHPGGPRRRAAS